MLTFLFGFEAQSLTTILNIISAGRLALPEHHGGGGQGGPGGQELQHVAGLQIVSEFTRTQRNHPHPAPVPVSSATGSEGEFAI